MEASFGKDEHVVAGQRMALPIPKRLVTKATKRNTRASLMTQGMRKKPNMKVTDQQSMSAMDTPSSMDAIPSIITWRCSGWAPSSGDRSMVGKSAQSS